MALTVTREARLYRMAKKQGLKFRKQFGSYSIGVGRASQPYRNLEEAEACIECGYQYWKNNKEEVK
jgi:hypothetical protein